MRLPRLVVLVMSAAPVVLAGAASSCGGQGSPPADAAAPSPDGSAAAAAEDAAVTGDAGAEDADAGDAGSDAAVAPPLPSWSAEPFPEKRSPMPKKAEWEGAPRVAIDRATPETLFQSREGDWRGCSTRRLLEWVQIRCAAPGGTILLGGNADGISLRDGEAVFPVRRGDRRVLELLDASETVNAHTTEVIGRQLLPGLIVSEQWIAGDERPTLVAADHAARPR